MPFSPASPPPAPEAPKPGRLGRRGLPAWSEPWLFGIAQSALTSLATTLVQGGGLGPAALLRRWLWAWLVVLPVVLAAAPLLRRLLGRLLRP
jgi:hypothetical protein